MKNSKDIYFEMKLDGHLKETSWLKTDESVRKKNLQAIKNVVKYLENEANKPHEKIKNSYLWKDIDKSVVVKFLEECEVYFADPFGIKSRMPIDFVKKYAQDVNTLWDIALYSGSSKYTFSVGNISVFAQERQIVKKDLYYEILNRQVSSGAAESIGLPETIRKTIGSNRKNIREKLEKPLLMLHVLDVKEKNSNTIDKNLAAFGVSFPGGIKSTKNTVKLKINSVYIQNLLDEEEFDD